MRRRRLRREQERLELQRWFEMRNQPPPPRRMLVMSRRKGQSIVINDDIYIHVVEILPDRVRLGVEAPKEVPEWFRAFKEGMGQ